MKGDPLFEADFEDCSYGFRPQRCAHQALDRIREALRQGLVEVYDADLKGYFDSIPQDKLMACLQMRISDRSVLRLIRMWLKAPVVEPPGDKGKGGSKRGKTRQGRKIYPRKGCPQGGVISPLLANLYLHPLDRLMREKGYHMIRYADDFVVMCSSAEAAQSALAEVREWVEQNGLSLHPDKTHVGDCSVPGQGFEFLGYRFEAGKRWVRKKSLKALRERIRSRTKRTRGDSIEHIIEGVNPMLRGWFGYFKHANSYVFKSIDGYMRRRLRAILRKQQKRPGMGHTHKDHQRWPNAYFAGHGLFTMSEAHALASRSRC